jgi:hypothetical protein
MSSGNWNNGVIAGVRAVNANNYPWNVNTNIGVRLACDNFSLLERGKECLQNYGFASSGYSVRKNRQIGCPHPCGG